MAAIESHEARASTQVDWRRLHALGLPSGSIRALLAILIFATTWALLIMSPAREVPAHLRNLLFVIMGHYFASRRRVEGGDGADPGPPPLFLPRGSVRLILVVGCLAVASLLLRRGDLARLDENPGAVTLLMVAGFLLGVTFNAVLGWWRDRGHRPHRSFEDARALVSLAAAVALVGLVGNRLHPVVPPDQVDAWFASLVRLGPLGPEDILAAVVGFYFGSRS